ncbi:bile acid:sodium symporter family protein [Rummeliibacillus sp. POC4]|uniref:bile acid:sodium symporter family protein n=1 Tax=Rummeliibacillus sp. POC4 TaxID=2305899 RepID=UPI000E673987|nr:bile acid:sodium symporter family protein [Rummeliibacillus sp. POC4]RIJ63509.1 bile acid:sodium symporter family protein [Rummeliibacillus sp. POC4]
MDMLEKVGKFAGNTFALWVLLLAGLALYSPDLFTWIGPYVSLLLGIVMFGMGMTLSVGDFKLVLKEPKGVIIGVLAQFIIMPSLAYVLAKVLQLSPEVAVGVILVGSCPGGTASNVMTFLSKGNTALSVTITSITTLLAPILTPAIIYFLASEWLNVSAGDMFLSVVKMVLIPIILGIIVKLIFKNKTKAVNGAMPIVSVVAIVAIVAAVVSGSRDKILDTGLLIFAVVILHNSLGLLLGFFVAKLLKLNYEDQKAVSIEVGMQNSGLGAALAMAHFSPLAAVPSAIFSVWHNISGPILASYWGWKADRQKEREESTKEKVEEHQAS